MNDSQISTSWLLLIGGGLLIGILGGGVAAWHMFGDDLLDQQASLVFSMEINPHGSSTPLFGERSSSVAASERTPVGSDDRNHPVDPVNAGSHNPPPTPVDPAASGIADGRSPSPTPVGPAASANISPNAPSSPTATVAVVARGAYDSVPNRPQQVGLVPAPLSGLVEQAPEGPLPVISADGTVSREAYAREFTGEGRKRIAIVLVNMGLSAAVTEAAIYKTAPEVTLAFNPYGGYSAELAQKARQQGHEVLLMIPQESAQIGTRDPGPLGLVTGLGEDEINGRLRKLMAVLTGYVGLMEPMGSRYVGDREGITRLLTEVKSRGLLYVGAEAGPRSKVADVASGLNVAHVSIDRKLDGEPSRRAIDNALGEVLSLADQRGWAVAVARPLPSTIERLHMWGRNLDRTKYVLAPISAMVKGN